MNRQEKEQFETDLIETVIVPRASDIGIAVQRSLPAQARCMIGPFIFWDQMGPGTFAKGEGLDVRPHPHIGLSTVTYLFEGSLDHRDSLGNNQRILPGDVNLMTAGSGITHSERTGQEVRQAASSLFGIQSWLALPLAQEEMAPSFLHIPKKDLCTFDDVGLCGRVILGTFQGVRSPVPTNWETLYVMFDMSSESKMSIPAETEERALYLLKGEIDIDGIVFAAPLMVVLRPGNIIQVRAKQTSQVLLLGGAVMEGARYICWNFVSSRKERIEQAKQEWQAGHFALIPGDDQEFIPLNPSVKMMSSEIVKHTSR